MVETAKTTLNELRAPAPREANMPAVSMGFGSLQSFELMQRAAKMLTHSTLVPVAYRAAKEVKEYGKVVGYEDNPNGLPNCVVALNMAQRMGADPLMVMQNLYIVEGRPSWSSQFIIAAINSCGRYSPLRFELSEAGKPEVITYQAHEWQDPPGGGRARKVTVEKKATVCHQTCYAWAVEKETGQRLQSPTISIQMAIDEGWLTKNGSKWQTMPEVMLRYRAAAFFGKIYAPELLMGLQTAEETADVIDINPDGSYTVSSTTVEELRSGSTRGPRHTATSPDDVDDVSRKTPTPTVADQWAKYDEVLATYGEEEASNFMPAEPRPSASNEGGISTSPTGSESNTADQSPTFNDIKRDLLEAQSVEDVDYARSLIKNLDDEQAKASLNAIAARRIRELAPVDEPPPQTQRRQRAPIGAE